MFWKDFDNKFKFYVFVVSKGFFDDYFGFNYDFFSNVFY